jgi:hypothetical protein
MSAAAETWPLGRSDLMHPRVFLDSFWRNDIRDEVFVAMSFADAFQQRWDDIVRPAVERAPIDGRTLRAIRVDTRRSGESILTEIIDGIAHSQLVVADISVVDRWVDGAERRAARNGNVMYEVGLALACRQPVEVLLIRDDDERLLFDVSTIPVLRNDPQDPIRSQEALREAIVDRLRERSLQRDLRLRRTLESLSQFEINLIRSNRHLERLGWNGPGLPAAVAMSLPALLEKQVLRLERVGTDTMPAIYTWTVFGREVAHALPAADQTA